MILQEFLSTLQTNSDDSLVAQLLAEVEQWKENHSTVEDLQKTVERFLENVWIPNEHVHKAICEAWSVFKLHSIKGIGGMTANERLYVFGLLDRFDKSATDQAKEAVLSKLLPNPAFQRTASGGR